jgi:hypothetical protein
MGSFGSHIYAPKRLTSSQSVFPPCTGRAVHTRPLYYPTRLPRASQMLKVEAVYLMEYETFAEVAAGLPPLHRRLQYPPAPLGKAEAGVLNRGPQ